MTRADSTLPKERARFTVHGRRVSARREEESVGKKRAPRDHPPPRHAKSEHAKSNAAMNPPQQRALPSFSGLSSAVSDARGYEKSRVPAAPQQPPPDNTAAGGGGGGGGNNPGRRPRMASPTSETSAATSGLDGRIAPAAAGGVMSSKTDAAGNVLVQDTLTPLLDEVDALFEQSKEIVASIKAQGKQQQEEDVSLARLHACWFVCRLSAHEGRSCAR